MTEILKFIDFDARRDPKTRCYCVMCQRDLKDRQSRRIVYVDANMNAVNPIELAARGRLDDDIGWQFLGADCARTLGLEWSLEVDAQLPLPLIESDQIHEKWLKLPRPKADQATIDAFMAMMGPKNVR